MLASSISRLLRQFAMGGTDVDIGLLVNLRKFIEDECMCSMGRGGALTHNHFQMFVNGNFISLPLLKKIIKVCWDGIRVL